jgi:nucleoside-diphosphate-sugar epimerase
VGLLAAHIATGVGRVLLGRKVKLPGLFVPIRYRARFRPLRFSNEKAQLELGWRPRWSFDEAWRRVSGHTDVPGALTAGSARPTPAEEVAVE